MNNKQQLSPDQQTELLNTLNVRFAKNSNRHTGLDWTAVLAKLEAAPEKLWSLYEMERTGGEPDVVGQDTGTGEYIFLIVRPKPLKVAGVFALIGKHWTPEKKTNQPTPLWIWRWKWALNC